MGSTVGAVGGLLVGRGVFYRQVHGCHSVHQGGFLVDFLCECLHRCIIVYSVDVNDIHGFIIMGNCGCPSHLFVFVFFLLTPVGVFLIFDDASLAAPVLTAYILQHFFRTGVLKQGIFGGCLFVGYSWFESSISLSKLAF